MSYKYCIVPKCKSTTSSTPNKLFFRVPTDQKTRKTWCSVVNRNPLSSKSTHYCCEDHFDVENDMENYIRYRLAGGQLRLRKGVLPHKFDCQRKGNAAVERAGYKKRQQIEYFERVLNPEDLLTQEEFVACDSIDFESLDTEVINPIAKVNATTVNNKPNHKSIAVQVNIKTKVRSKGTNTDADQIPKLKRVKINKVKIKRVKTSGTTA